MFIYSFTYIFIYTHICIYIYIYICAWGVFNIPIWFVCLTWYGLFLHDMDLYSMLRYVCVLHTCVFTCLQVSRVSAEGNFHRKRWKRWRSLKLSHKSIQYINIVVIYCCHEFVYGDSLNTLNTLGNFAKIALAFDGYCCRDCPIIRATQKIAAVHDALHVLLKALSHGWKIPQP